MVTMNFFFVSNGGCFSSRAEENTVDIQQGLASTKQSWKCILSSDAPIRGSLFTAEVTALLMVDSALGHDVS
jgi:hypothetical protein